MCGIVCYVGKRQAQPVLLSGLKRLEYRGYDSSGIALVSPKKSAIVLKKAPGKIRVLEAALRRNPLKGTVGIAHTRWATHGAPTQPNAHPHTDNSGEVAVVHNGIIENFEQLRLMLQKDGVRFKSQTDTEVIAHLIAKYYAPGVPLEKAVARTAQKLTGSFALGVVSSREPAKLVGARLGSPLIVGIGRQENFLASDVSALLDSTKKVIFLEENEIAVLDKDKVALRTIGGKPVRRKPSMVTWDVEQAQKQGYRHFMLKEINEQPGIVESVINRRVLRPGNRIHFDELSVSAARLRRIKSIAIVACGTAYHAGMVGKYVLESLCGIPTSVDVSSEFRYRSLLIGRDTLVIPISQSGETADTLAGLREAQKHGSVVVSICNVLGSTIARESDGVIYTHAGPEIGVASTKAYTAQLVALYLFALYLGQVRRSIRQAEIARNLHELRKIPGCQRQVLKQQQTIARLSRSHSHFGSFLYLGRNVNYPSALEGALKLKEISYIPAEGYAAGEMKHGPIALIDEYRAVVCLCPHSDIYEKMVSNIQEILSRRGKIIIIASNADALVKTLSKEVIFVPRTPEMFSPLVVSLPLQLLAYHISVKRRCNVDQPRNLAKSVTVE
ncbi:MAG: glutamine--fructose-6-phosphate transaminase (isomerizing) [Candidatus Omnitrophica bacterium]|nr:glutamine--fructose-6-phosphate transaminase (isomerizing) [Candidatus Omnitrophota bacterium]